MTDNPIKQEGKESIAKASKIIAEAMRLNHIHPLDASQAMLLLLMSTCKAFQTTPEKFDAMLDAVKKEYRQLTFPAHVEKKIEEFWRKQ